MESLKRLWRRRQYRRLRSTKPNRKRLQIVVFGGGPRRSWRIKSVPKLRFNIVLSPLKLWRNIKSAYASTMVKLSGRLGYLNDGDDFRGKRIPKEAGGGRPVSYGKEEFEKRLIFEIYKSLVASKEMVTIFT